MSTRRAIALLAVAAVLALGLSLTAGGAGAWEITLRIHRGWGLVLVALLAALGVLAGRALRGQGGVRRRRIPRARDATYAEHHRFLRRLDHELKNPLTAILVAVSNVRSECSPAGQEVLTSIETQALRLSRLVRDLRKLAEIETLPLEEVVFDIRETLEEAAALAQEQAGQDPRRLALIMPEAPPDALPVRGDQDLLLVAIHNLIDNALKFSRAGDRIELRAYRDGHSVVVQVRDTGRGISATDQPLVWEELYRGQNTDGIPGSGIGLTLVQAIITRSQGEVSLESEPGKGTTVTVRLPEAKR